MEEKEVKFNEETKELTFKIYNDPHGDPLYDLPEESITFNPGLTCLVGCNGYGKTTLLNRIREIHHNDDDIFELVEINDRYFGGNTLMQKTMLAGDIMTSATMFQSSEGEKIIIYLGDALSTLKQKIIDNKKKAFVITIDSIDSGLSIDKIELVKDILINYVAKEAPNVYILLAVISYEFAKDTRCVDCYNGKEVKFRLGYDSYAKFIKQTAKIRNQRCSD